MVLFGDAGTYLGEFIHSHKKRFGGLDANATRVAANHICGHFFVVDRFQKFGQNPSR